MVRSWRGLVAATAAAVLTFSLAACGTSDGGGQQPSADTPVTVHAGFIPVIDVAALYLGDEKGFFKETGIDLKVHTGQGGAALVPPVVSGEYHFAFSNLVSVLTARSKGLPLQIIGAGSSSTGTEGEDVTMLHVPKDSPIKSAADLEGKKVSVNTLGNLLEMLGRTSVDAAGGDSSKVEFVELGFPEAVAALKSGDIDAMVGAEPFGTLANAQGNRVISSPYLEMSDDSMLTSVYFGNEQQIAENPELFTALRKAIDRSLEYAQKHQDEVRAQLAKYTEIEPDVIEKVILPTFSPEIPKASVDRFIEQARKYKMLEGKIAYDDIVWRPAS